MKQFYSKSFLYEAMAVHVCSSLSFSFYSYSNFNIRHPDTIKASTPKASTQITEKKGYVETGYSQK